MKSKLFRIIISILVISILLFNNFSSLCFGLITYANDSVQLENTNNQNIKFNSYFTDSKNENLEAKIDNQNITLSIDIDVIRDGYFYGKLNLEESNFEFVNSDSIYINQLGKNEIILNKINNGTLAHIEIDVKPIISDKLNKEDLDKKSKLKLSGQYFNKSDKVKEISAEKELKLKLISGLNDDDVSFEPNVITNKLDTYNNEEKRILQFDIKTGLLNNQYPIKNIKIEVNDNETKNKQVLINSNLANMSNVSHIVEQDNNVFYMENKSEKINFNKEAQDELVITYLYDKDANLENTILNLKAYIELYDEKIIEKTKSLEIGNEEKDNIIIINEKFQNKLYDSMLKIGEDLNYKSNIDILVNLDNVAQSINFKNTDFINSNISKVNIDKSKFMEFFGEDGFIDMIFSQNSNEIKRVVVNKSSFANADSITINLENDIDKLEVQTTKPLKIGTFSIELEKVTKEFANGYISSKLSGKYISALTESNKEINSTEIKENINRSTSNARVEMNTYSLTSVEKNKNVDFKVTLLTSDDSFSLYKDPEIKIILPNDIKTVVVNSVDKIYADEFEIDDYSVSGNEILVKLKGINQNNYTGAVEGSVISINADIELKNTTISKNELIKVEYINNCLDSQYPNNDSIGRIQKEINFVSPKGLITILDIPELEITTNGIKDEIQKLIDKNSQDIIKAKVSNLIVNNDSKIEDVKITGKINNSSVTSFESPIRVLNSDQDYKIYYTNNIDASDDINDENNAYTTELNLDAKKYLIKIDSFENGNMISYEYDIDVKNNLEYDMNDDIKYNISYLNSQTGMENYISSTNVKITTGQGPKLQANMTLKSGSRTLSNEEKVRKGQVLTYELILKNIGSKEAKDINIENIISDNLESSSDLKTKIDEIKPDETKNIKLNVEVKDNANVNDETQIKSIIECNGDLNETNPLKNIIEDAKLSVKFEQLLITGDIKEELKTSYTTRYMATVKNLTDQTIKNAKLIWNLPDEIKILNTVYEDGDIDDLAQKTENGYEPYTNKELMLRDILPNETVQIVINVLVLDTINTNNIHMTASVEISDKAFSKQVYVSNQIEDKISTLGNIEIELNANNEDEYLNPGNIINYNLKIKSLNTENVGVYIKDDLPDTLSLKSTNLDQIQGFKNEDNKLTGYYELGAGETKEFNIETVVNFKEVESSYNDKIENLVSIIACDKLISSNAVVHNVSYKVSDTDNSQNIEVDDSKNIVKKPSSQVSNDSSNDQTNNSNNNNNKANNIIQGVVFKDSNSNGIMDNGEEKLSGIKVYLIKVNDANLISNTISDNGMYKFDNIENGQYSIIFDYDTAIYRATSYKVDNNNSKTSKAIELEMNINDVEKTYGVTDIIDVNNKNISNINLGLIENKKFDLKLDKYISKITTITSKGTKNYEYKNNSQLSKIEFETKELENANVMIEYSIVVTNVGELAGYVKSVVDYMPNDTIFSSELNKDWYVKDDGLYNTSIANQKINPGESKTLKLILSKKMTTNNIGRLSNSAEIYSASNELGIEDINSTPGNRKQNENDYSTADSIITIKTGETEIALFIITGVIITYVAGYITIKNKELVKIQKRGKENK